VGAENLVAPTGLGFHFAVGNGKIPVKPTDEILGTHTSGADEAATRRAVRWVNPGIPVGGVIRMGFGTHR
jgi:hypothetical protein